MKIQVWPEGYNSNTAKEVLLLHELEAVLDSGVCPSPCVASALPLLLPKVHHRCLFHIPWTNESASVWF